jgi:nucleolar protein 4
MGDNERSKGFGFVEFEDHDHALIGLREVNNSPKYFGEKRRLLVEFALEDKRVVEGRQKRLQVQQFKQKKLRDLDAKDARDGVAPKRKPAQQKPGQQQQQQQQQNGKKGAASPQKPKAGQQQQPQQQPAGQKRKREDNGGAAKKPAGAGNNKSDTKPAKAGQQKRQKVAPEAASGTRDEKGQAQRKRARGAEAAPALSRKERVAAKKRKDIDALDSMGTRTIPLQSLFQCAMC